MNKFKKNIRKVFDFIKPNTERKVALYLGVFTVVTMVLSLLINENLRNSFITGQEYRLENNTIDNISFVIILLSLISLFLFIAQLIIIYRNNAVNEVKEYYEDLKDKMLTREETVLNENISETHVDHVVDHTVEFNKTEEDIMKLMLINMREIKEYYVLSKNQAKKSFTLSVVLCVFGFILLAFSIFFLYYSKWGVGSAVITVIGGSIVELLAGTSLFVYKSSISQLNHYYEAIHENERFLSIVNLVGKISNEKQDEIYIEIIRSELRD